MCKSQEDIGVLSFLCAKVTSGIPWPETSRCNSCVHVTATFQTVRLAQTPKTPQVLSAVALFAEVKEDVLRSEAEAVNLSDVL
jgi:hypothetical protein